MSSGGPAVTVKVLEARNLIALDKNGKSDPYCTVTFGGQKEKTKSLKKTLEPAWNETFVFPFEEPLPAEMTFEVFDWNMFSAHKRMGIARLALKDAGYNRDHVAWLPIGKVKETDTVSGDVRVQVHVNYPSAPVVDHPIFEAIRNSELEAVRKWVADPSFDINCVDAYGYTPLHSACLIFSRFDYDILECLLKHAAVNVNVRNKENNTPLHYFCAKFRSATAQDVFELFMAKHADINAQNSAGETPMHKAVLNESVRSLLLQSLIKYGADCNKQSAQTGQTALHYAVHLNREDLVTLLLRGGARVDIKGGKEPKKTPFELALELKLNNMVRLMQRAQDINIWLKDLELEQYAPLFIKEELYKEVLPEITEKDLERIGVAVAGHRVKIMKAIKSLSGDALQSNGVALAPVEEKKVLTMEEQLQRMKYVTRGTKFIEHRALEFMTKLGSGTSGVVYKGLYKEMTVAIKVLNGEQTEKEMTEFKKEFQIMSAIESSYTVFLFGAVTEPKLCMVMEFCSRGSLYHVLNDNKVDCTWPLLFQFSRELVNGLLVLHGSEPQILHRDFKSLNILIDENFHAKVADFGTARFNTDTSSATLSKSGVGTYAYMAPEVYFGEKFTTKADLYAVGIVLWEVLYRCMNRTYLRPYGEFKNVMYPVIQAAKKNLRPTIPESCPASLSKLISDLWDKDAQTRPECPVVLERLAEIEKEWEADQAAWDAVRAPPE